MAQSYLLEVETLSHLAGEVGQETSAVSATAIPVQAPTSR
tara:strand:+ start:350 stop:469 length:120 start_codon:yes stop_codon:yes gene_type:complete